MSNISLTYQWVISACNSPTVGYSQTYRKGIKVNGITYYDCSSLLSAGLTVGGFFSDNPWFTTYTMRDLLTSIGFVKLETDVDWLPGDILWRSGHTEMVYSGRRTMGAHTGGVALANQVSINNYDSSPSSWSELYRYMGGTTLTYNWIKGNYYLSENEMKNNAFIVYSTLYNKNWSVQAIAGLLGNMESESTINPGIWQSLNVNPSGGYGLVQWTPSTNYTDWCYENGYAIDDGDYQLIWIDEKTVHFGQWIETDEYPLTFGEFKVSTKTPEYLACVFLKNFERAGVEVENARMDNARKWYDYIKNLLPWLPINVSTKKKLPIWMMV